MTTATKRLLSDNRTSRLVVNVKVTSTHFELFKSVNQKLSTKKIEQKQKVKDKIYEFKKKRLLILSEHGAREREFRGATDQL